ncbi:helix-turn-helix transcriptional regulator [Paracoccus marcusii]|uniref:helix-turn-helix transcriptional regulator n=1 Tax=Paracoccus marcusii TaxID=59779 RepID=UPI001FCB015D|nr:AraC family transcriptional regulator [Paracoccus marcusii]
MIHRCSLNGVEAVTADSFRAFGRHSHDQFGIGVIIRGAQISASGRGLVEAEAGDVITVNPGEVHDGAPLGDGGRAWRMLYFDPVALADRMRIMTEHGVYAGELAHPAIRDIRCANRFHSLYRTLTSRRGSESEIEGEETLMLLLSRLVERSPRAEIETPQSINQARARIDDDPATPLTLAELSAIGDLSQFQLVRGFAKATGLTPHAYLVQRRLHLARRLISNGETLAHSAHAAGFSDQSHMTRLFIRTYGLTPGAYAAAMR